MAVAPERLEDVFQEMAERFGPTDFRDFARAQDGLCLDENEIQTIRADYENSSREQKIQMLEKWRSKNASLATCDEIRRIVKKYLNCDEGCISLGGGIYLFHKQNVGEYPHIYHGEQRSDAIAPEKLAIKRLDYTEKRLKEAKALRKVSYHRNVVALIYAGKFKQGELDFIFIAMELCHEQNLFHHIKLENHGLDSDLSIQWAKQVLDGLTFIHEKNIAHRDLKPHNILLTRDLKSLKIADFGFSKPFEHDWPISATNRLIGTDGYRAPETYNENKADAVSDIFSLGLLMFFVWSNGFHPYGDDHDDWNGNIKRNRGRSFHRLESDGPLDEQQRRRAEDLLERMLQFDRNNRPSGQEIVNLWPILLGYQPEDQGAACASERLTRGGQDEAVLAVSSCQENEDVDAAVERECLFLFDLPEKSLLVSDTPLSGDITEIKFEKIMDLIDIFLTETLSTVMLNGSIYVLTWAGRVYEAKPFAVENNWEAVDGMRYGHGRFPPAAATKDSIYVCGGGWASGGRNEIGDWPLDKITNKAEKYKQTDGRWVDITSMNVKRRHNAVAADEDFVYCIGGLDESSEPLASAEKYDPNADKWMEIKPLNSARCKAAAVEFGGKIYVLGGKGNGNITLSEVECLDPLTGDWTVAPSMLHRRSSFKACVADGLLFAVGGDASGVDEFPSKRTIERFDAVKQEWVEVMSMQKSIRTADMASLAFK